MPKYARWGMARYKEVRPALLDWKGDLLGLRRNVRITRP